MVSSPHKLLVIVGETATGKSALAMELAKKFEGEIIGADSWTVYKGFDIGTAKPSQAERGSIPHHLLDVAEPKDGFSAPQFQRLALAAIDDISRRGKLAIMVGGSGLYVDSVIYNYSFLPPSVVSERATLNGLSLAELLAIAQERRLPLETIDARNKRRVIRLIENNGQMPTRSALGSNTLLIGVLLARDQLVTSITARVDEMLASGLEQEARVLAQKYGWDCEPLKGVGYREWQGYFSGKQTLPETRAKIIKSTLDLAKKQRTWFRRNSSIHWLTDRDKLAQAVELTTTLLDK